MEILEAAVAQLEAEDDDFVDPRRLAAVVDRLQAKLSRVVAASRERGEHLLAGCSAVTWESRECQMSKNSAADRLCVGEQLGKLPRIASALSSGELGYQAASVICHLSQRVSEAGGEIDQEAWVENARKFSIKDLGGLAASTWHAVDPAGFNLKLEEAHQRRQLFLSECGDMYRIDGWLELSAGAVVKTALEALARPLGAQDGRSPKQR